MNAVFSEKVGVNPEGEFDLGVGEENEIGSSDIEISILF